MRVVLQILERIISNKQKKTKKLSILHRLLIYESHIYMLRIFFLKKNFDVPILPVAIGSLLYLTPS